MDKHTKSSGEYLWEQVFQFIVEFLEDDEPRFPLNSDEIGHIAGDAAYYARKVFYSIIEED